MADSAAATVIREKDNVANATRAIKAEERLHAEYAENLRKDANLSGRF